MHFQGARLFFEVGLAREAARPATEDDLTALKRRARRQQQAIGDRSASPHRHRLPFRTGASIARNLDLRRAARPDLGMAEGAARRDAGSKRPGAAPPMMRTRAIYEAIAARDADRAEQAMRDASRAARRRNVLAPARERPHE